jgi:multicomponent Na+:H+ antiporter subunit D
MIQLFWLVLLPIMTGIITYLFFAKHAKYVVLVMQSVFFAISFYIFYYVKIHGEMIDLLGGYDLGISIALRCDRVSAALILLNAFLFTCMIFFNYHKEYMNKLFLFLFLALQGLINGIFLSNDLFNIYVLTELSTIVVSILIMFKKDNQSIYDGMVYLLTNLVAMTFFLLGIGYIYKIFGSLDLTVIGDRMVYIEDPKFLILPYSLIITAVGLKAALMPLFSWLPRAHGTPSAPSIVSAILSGLYVKCGVYLFIRTNVLFQPVLDTTHIFLVIGFLTAVIGFVFALSQTDIKLILAYSTVSQIGLIIFGLSLNHEYSYEGSIYHILNHAIFKSVLFLTAGMIIEEYETRDIREIRGVFRRMPFVAIVTIMAILGITGAPLFNGSISKYLIQKGTYVSDLLEYGLILINVGTIMCFVKYASMLMGPLTGEKYSPRFNQKIVIGLLGLTCFVGGIFGANFIEFLFNVDVQISIDGYIRKSIIYVVSLVFGVFFYRVLYHRLGLFNKIREIELPFNEICLSIVIFFACLYSYLQITF